MRNALCILLLMSLLWPTQQVYGARNPEEYSKVSLFYLYNSWQDEHDNDEYTIGEGVFGTKAHQVVNPRLTVDFWGAITSAGYSDSKPEGTEIDFSSLNDIRLKGMYYFQEGLFSAALSLNLPTGKTSLSNDEYLLAIGVADNSRKYIVRRFGQGLDIGGEVFFLPHTGNADFRLGGGYLYKGSYQLREQSSSEYKFGNELFAQAAVEVKSRPVGFYGSIAFRSYSEDEADSRAVFQQGNTIMINGRLDYSDRTQAAVGFSLLTRGSAKISSEGEELTEESVKSGRDELLLYISGNHPVSPRLRVLGRLEFKSITANDYPENSTGYRPGGSYIGLGGGLNARLALNWSAGFMATYYTGGMDDDHDLTGLGLATVLTYRYW